MGDRPALRAVVVVPHTHWDREWYQTADRVRQRLVEVMDGVQRQLSVPSSDSFFLLDGQVVAVEDYLSVVPGRRDDLSRLVSSGKLALGPWYVLADEILVSDETLVRNLLVGQRIGRALGAWLRVGYMPDSFGHPAAMPTILAGFGIEDAIVWRGYGGEPGQDSDLFRWFGPDGSVVLANHLPPDGYEYGAELPTDSVALATRWNDVRATLASRSVTGVALLLNGADHHAMQPDLPAIVSGLRGLEPSVEFQLGGPDAYFDRVRGVSDLPRVTGELRFSYRYTWTLQGVHATRSRLKRSLAESERLLIRWAEPMTALASWEGKRDRRPEMRDVWKAHLRCCAHDSIGGCCTDEVATQVSHRAARACASARALFVDAVYDRLGVDRTRARRSPDKWRPQLAIVNPTPRPRGGVVEATICRFLRHVRVGPGSGTVGSDERDDRQAWIEQPVVRDANGRTIPIQVLGEYEGYDRFDSPRDYPDQDVVRAIRVAISAPEIPALGATTYAVAFVKPSRASAADRVDDAVGADRRMAWSNHYRVRRGVGVAFSVALLNRGETVRRVGHLVSELDLGDTYTFQPSDTGTVEAKWGVARVGFQGPLVASIAREFTLPGRASGVLHVVLHRGSRLLRMVVEGVNHCGNHRMRVHLPLRVPAEASVADMHYGPVTRRHERYRRADFPIEWPVATAPMHRFVSVGDGESGFTVHGRGLYEYELCRDSVAVTLLRAVSELSKADLPARPGNAGYPSPTPDAMELGPFRAELAVSFGAVSEASDPADWATTEALAEEFHAPLAGVMVRQAIDLPNAIHGPRLSGDGLVLKSVKSAEDGAALVLRCVNVTCHRVTGTWQMPKPVRRACLTRIDETPLRDIQLDGDRMRLSFGAEAREVVTVLVWS